MPPKDRIFLLELKVACIIGIFPWERAERQPVLIDMDFPADIRGAARRDRIEDAIDYKRIAKATIRFVEKSRFHLLETLAEELADLLLSEFPIQEVHLKASKPGAIRGSRNVGVEVTRTKKEGGKDLVFLGLGSNVNPGFHLSNALGTLSRQFTLRDHSHVYETSPVGGRKGQAPFWNMALALDQEGTLEGMKGWLRRIESQEGRSRGKDRSGDRTLDLDLLLWGDRQVSGGGTQLPHPDLSTKAFAIFPLLEIAPCLVVPGSGSSMVELAANFSDRSQKIRRILKLPTPPLEVPPPVHS